MASNEATPARQAQPIAPAPQAQPIAPAPQAQPIAPASPAQPIAPVPQARPIAPAPQAQPEAPAPSTTGQMLIPPPPRRYHRPPRIPRLPVPTLGGPPYSKFNPPTPLDTHTSKHYFSIFLKRDRVTEKEYTDFLKEDQKKHVYVHYPIRHVNLPGPVPESAFRKRPVRRIALPGTHQLLAFKGRDPSLVCKKRKTSQKKIANPEPSETAGKEAADKTLQKAILPGPEKLLAITGSLANPAYEAMLKRMREGGSSVADGAAPATPARLPPFDGPLTDGGSKVAGFTDTPIQAPYQPAADLDVSVSERPGSATVPSSATGAALAGPSSAVVVSADVTSADATSAGATSAGATSAGAAGVAGSSGDASAAASAGDADVVVVGSDIGASAGVATDADQAISPSSTMAVTNHHSKVAKKCIMSQGTVTDPMEEDNQDEEMENADRSEEAEDDREEGKDEDMELSDDSNEEEP